MKETNSATGQYCPICKTILAVSGNFDENCNTLSGFKFICYNCKKNIYK